jgi:hypothetical protein
MTPYARITVGSNNDVNVEATILAALLGSHLDDSNASTFWQYAHERRTKDILISLEELQYITGNLAHLKAGAVSFTVNVDGKVINKKLERGETFKLTLTQSQLSKINFVSVAGAVGLVSYYDKPVTEIKNTSNKISVTREYFVGEQKTNTFKQSDIIKIKLTPTITDSSLEGDYEIYDILPSGLKIIPDVYSRNLIDHCGTAYPIGVKGQINKFLSRKYFDHNISLCGDVLTYYARVISPGEYTAESVLLQSVGSASLKVYSSSQKIIIKQ